MESALAQSASGSIPRRVVHGASEALLASEVAFRCVSGDMPEQELDLVQLSPAK
jgi:hypothetical protein